VPVDDAPCGTGWVVDESIGTGPATAGSRAAGSELSEWRSSLLFGSVAWLVCWLGYVAVTSMSRLSLDAIREPLPSLQAALHSWERWDTIWYEHIAHAGYASKPSSTAFFPLYPMLIRLTDVACPGGTPAATLVVSMLTCYAALVLTHRLTAEVLGERIARRTACYLFAFPTGFFLAAGYNESLFIALCAGSLYCMHRSQWWPAGALASLAGATRITGFILLVAFLYEYLRQRGFSWRRIQPDILALALAPLGLSAYAGYCWKTFGDPLYFQKAQAAWNRSSVVMPWTTARQMMHLIDQSRPLGAVAVRNTISLSTTLIVVTLLCLALAGRLRLGPQQVYLVIFSGLSFLIPWIFPIHGNYPLVSIWRYALECLPVFMVLAKIGENRHVDRMYLLSALPAQALMIYSFTHGSFVA
jgi:Gpi18-like mannosyltransferase